MTRFLHRTSDILSNGEENCNSISMKFHVKERMTLYNFGKSNDIYYELRRRYDERTIGFK
ncbi:hypothetical protein bcgnr5411_24400 [Bacillus cereus]